MKYTKQKFILELENYFENFPSYSISEVLYSLGREFKDNQDLLTSTDEEVIESLSRAQMFETEN